jgi:flagellar FliL protein
MQKSIGFTLRKCLALFMLASLLAMTNANASEHGGGGGEGGGAYVKLEPFTVNLVGLTQVVQVSATLKMAKPEMGAKVSVYMPAVRNEVIILLGGKTAEQLGTPEGKQLLIKEMKKVVNKAVGLDAKEGVADVLLEQIIIQ